MFQISIDKENDKKRQVLKIRFYNSKQRKELPMTKEAKIRITIEIENSQRMITEFVIQSDLFGQRMSGNPLQFGWKLEAGG